MQQAAERLIGQHDFRAFGRSPTGRSTVRTVTRAEWAQAAPDEYTFTVQANAFLYRMVRRMVGTLVDVGRGRMPGERITALLNTPEGGVSLTLAPPDGLTLVSVEYASEKEQ
jgi:tRNA pseudouridine38-40 synthase